MTMKMKTATVIICFALLTLSLAACGGSGNSSSSPNSATVSSNADSEAIEGGWETPASPELTEEARAALTNATKDLSGAGYTPAALLGTQVVSGTNYKILCREIHGTLKASETWAIVTVYEDLEGNAEITEDEDSGNPTNISDEEGLTGGWEMADSPVLTEEDQKAFDWVFGGADKGYEISPVAILSYQVVSGENYCFLATKDSDGAYVFAYFYEDLDGNVSDAYTVDFVTEGNTDPDSDTSAVAGTSETQSSGNPLCVRIDGTVYRDTGYVSSAPGCGNMDGGITSTVDGSEMPSKDNQSNFGTGYGYQLGSDGLILVAMNDELEIFRDIHSTDTSIPDQVASFIGQVESINEDTIRVKYVGMPANSICFSPGDGEYDTSASSVEGNVEEGDYVRVWYTGSVAETYPAQIDAYRIEKINNYTPDAASST